jgi:hypothetical protein
MDSTSVVRPRRLAIGCALALALTACQLTTVRSGQPPQGYASPDGTPAGRPGEPSDPTAAVGGVPNPDAPFVGSPGKSRPGDRPSSAQLACDGAHDHCLPPNTVFATEWEGGAPDRAYVAVKLDEGPWAWERSDVVRGKVRVLDTERATSANLTAGATVVGFRMGEELGRVPASEMEAVAPYWQIGKVASVDRARWTFRVEGLDRPMAIVSARVVKNP